jgi:hypothetical protein
LNSSSNFRRDSWWNGARSRDLAKRCKTCDSQNESVTRTKGTGAGSPRYRLDRRLSCVFRKGLCHLKLCKRHHKKLRHLSNWTWKQSTQSSVPAIWVSHSDGPFQK